MFAVVSCMNLEVNQFLHIVPFNLVCLLILLCNFCICTCHHIKLPLKDILVDDS